MIFGNSWDFQEMSTFLGRRYSVTNRRYEQALQTDGQTDERHLQHSKVCFKNMSKHTRMQI